VVETSFLQSPFLQHPDPRYIVPTTLLEPLRWMFWASCHLCHDDTINGTTQRA